MVISNSVASSSRKSGRFSRFTVEPVGSMIGWITPVTLWISISCSSIVGVKLIVPLEPIFTSTVVFPSTITFSFMLRVFPMIFFPSGVSLPNLYPFTCREIFFSSPLLIVRPSKSNILFDNPVYGSKSRILGNVIFRSVNVILSKSIFSPAVIPKFMISSVGDDALSAPISLMASSISCALTSIVPVLLIDAAIVCQCVNAAATSAIGVASIMVVVPVTVTSPISVVALSILPFFSRWYSPSTSCKSSPSSISMILSSVIFSVYPTGIAKCSPPALIVMSISLFKS